MDIKVYTVSGAPRGWRVLIGLTLKGIEYDIQYLQLSENEHKAPKFLAISPRATVPVIEHKGTVIRDSLAILAWLDREYPDHPLFGDSSDQARDIWQIVTDCCDYLRDAIDGLLRPVLVENIALPDITSAEMQKLQDASDKLHRECAYLDKVLGQASFFCGATPSAAEAIAFPEIRLIQRAIDRKPDIMKAVGFDQFERRYSGLAAWIDRIEVLPDMNKTFPPHWNQ